MQMGLLREALARKLQVESNLYLASQASVLAQKVKFVCFAFVVGAGGSEIRTLSRLLSNDISRDAVINVLAAALRHNALSAEARYQEVSVC